MIDTNDWRYLYKIDYLNGHDVSTNMLYTPLINPEGNIMCMKWDAKDAYQIENTKLTQELVDYFFQREIIHLPLFGDYTWAPRIIDIDIIYKKIFIEWNTETCNHIILGKNRMAFSDICPDWEQQLFTIIKDITDKGYYKMSLYPHCFFLDKDNVLKTFDFYACVSQKERYISLKRLEGMMGGDKPYRFTEATVDDRIDFDIFFKRSLQEHISWPNNALNKIYHKIYDL